VSDISIPGIKSKYNTDQLVKGLVEVEKIPLKRMEESVKTYKNQQTYWRELNQAYSRLRDSARDLFGFQNPFNERTVVSSNDKVVTATATREALEGKLDLTVRKLAEADKFLSKPVDRDFTVPAGKYGFRVGEKESAFTFRGGKLQDFVQTLNDRAGDLVKAQLIKNSDSTQVLVVESLKTGAANTLSFLGDSAALGEKVGLLERNSATSRSFDLDANPPKPWTKPVSGGEVTVKTGTMKISPGGEAVLPLAPPLPIQDGMILEMEAKVTYMAKEVRTPPLPPPGPTIPDLGSTTLRDVSVPNSPSKVVLPEWKPPEPPKVVDDLGMMFLGTETGTVPLPQLSDSTDFVTLKIPLKHYANSVNSLNFRNNNTYRELEVRNVKIYDPASRGDFKPFSPVSSAQDAEISLNGVTIRRKSNVIDDLLPGVTLTLQGTGEAPVNLSVEPDRKKVKDTLIKFVGNYNQLVANINILTRGDENIINEISYLSDDERSKAKEKLGAFRGDLTLSQTRTTLQNIMSNAYPTRLEQGLSMLSQIGISTNARQGGGGSYDVTKLRGYLEINETQLDEGLKSKFLGIKDMFGSDTNGDLVMDSGIGVAVDNYLRPFVQTGGILSLKISTLDTQIGQTKRKIDSYNQYLSRYEQDMKRKYGAMEGALNSLEKSSQTIENFNKSHSSSR